MGGAAALPDEPTLREIAAAIPAGGRRARGQAEYLRALARDEELAGLRADRQRNIRACARILARRASWKLRTSRPVIKCATCRAGGDCRGLGPRRSWCLVRAAGVAVSTWKLARRWLESHAYLGLVRPGRAAWLRPASLVDEQTPNEAATFVLALPRRKPKPDIVSPGQGETRPLTSSTVGRRSFHPARARELPRAAAADDGSPLFVVAFLRSQVAELHRGPGKILSDKAVLAIARPFLAECWSPADLAFAIGHDPVTGRAHRTSLRTVRLPASWLAWRLTRWCTDPGQAWKSWHTNGRWDHDAWPIPASSPTARVVDRARAERAAAEQALSAQPPGGRVDPAPHANRIRQALGWARRPHTERTRLRWIQFPDHDAHQARLEGEPREGAVWAEGPRPGTVWAIPADRPERTWALVHYYPNAPEASYALDTEQPQPGDPAPATDDHHDHQ